MQRFDAESARKETEPRLAFCYLLFTLSVALHGEMLMSSQCSEREVSNPINWAGDGCFLLVRQPVIMLPAAMGRFTW
jgi:hypothetical protein